MDNKIQTIYEILETNDENLVMNILNELSYDERNLFNKRFGEDLNNPVLDSSWSGNDSIVFHTKLIPHMKDMLKDKETQEIPILDDEEKEKLAVEEYDVLHQPSTLESKQTEDLKSLNVEKSEEPLNYVPKDLNSKKESSKGQKRGRKLQTVYELLNTNDKKMVNELIETLTVDEKNLFDRRNGKDLDNPKHSDDWTNNDNIKFTSIVMRKLRYRMKRKSKIEEKVHQLKSIYKILETDDEKTVNDIINTLSNDEKEMITRRNGDDINHPGISDNWTMEDEYVFLETLVPKLQRKLSGKNNSSKAGEKLSSMYTLLGIKDKDLIMKAVSLLNPQEQILFKRRNGNDLDNPVTSDDWTSDDTNRFAQNVLPKIRIILERDYNIKPKKQSGFKTMFELLNTEDEDLILELKNELSDEEKMLFDRRNGSDLRNPKHSDDWTSADTIDFNAKIVKKMRRLLIRKQNGKVSRYLSIYKLLNTDDVTLVQKVIDRLTPDEKTLFWKRNGNDLNNPMPSEDYSSLDENRFNVNLILKMRNLMIEEKSKQEKDEKPEILDIDSKENDSSELLTDNAKEVKKEKEIMNESKCKDERLPYFDKVLRKLSIKDAVVASLKLVLNFNTNEISTFLNIEKTEITNIVKDTLNTYKIYFTGYIDSLIEEKSIHILVEEKDYLKAIRNLNFGDLLDRFSIKEAIILSLSLGLVNEKMYNADEISLFLTTNKEDVIKMNKKALLIYKQIISDNINKVIDEISEHEGPKK